MFKAWKMIFGFLNYRSAGHIIPLYILINEQVMLVSAHNARGSALFFRLLELVRDDVAGIILLSGQLAQSTAAQNKKERMSQP